MPKRNYYGQAVTGENRYKDFNGSTAAYGWTDAATWVAGGLQVPLDTILPGTGIDQRLGRNVQLKSLELRMTFKSQSHHTRVGVSSSQFDIARCQTERFRIMVIRKKMCVGDADNAAFTASQFLDSLGSGMEEYTSFYNRDTTPANFEILYDNRVAFDPPGFSLNTEWDFTNSVSTQWAGQSGFNYTLEAHVEINKLLRFSETDTDGLKIEQGRVQLIIMRDSDPLAATTRYNIMPTCRYFARMNFIG